MDHGSSMIKELNKIYSDEIIFSGYYDIIKKIELKGLQI